MRNISQRNLLSILVPTADADQQERTVVKVRANAEIAHRVLAQISSVRVRSATLRRSVLSAAFSGRLTGRSNGADLIEEMASA
jgi:type I restriction enzyme S subunit